MPLSGQVFVTLVTIGGYAIMKTIRRRDLRNAAAEKEKDDSVIISSNSGEQAAAEKEKEEEDSVVDSSNSEEQGNDETKITSEMRVDDIFFSFIKTLALDTSRMAKETLKVVAEMDGVAITFIAVEAHAIFYLLTMSSTKK